MIFKKFLLSVLVLMCVFPLVSANNVMQVNVNTLPHKIVVVNLLDPSQTYYSVGIQTGDSQDGKVNFNFSTDLAYVDIAVIVKTGDGQRIFYNRYKNYDSSQIANLYVLVNETQDETTVENVATNTSGENSVLNVTETGIGERKDQALGGAAVSESLKNDQSSRYYIIGGIVFLLIVLVVVGKLISSKKLGSPTQNATPKKYYTTGVDQGKISMEKSNVTFENRKVEGGRTLESQESRIREAERKIEEARRELESLRKK